MLAISQNTILLGVAIALVIAAIVLATRKPAPKTGEPLTPKTVAGMFHGKPEAWRDFRELLKQPGPPDPRDAVRDIVREVLDERKPKGV